jgi:hypothetical protein
MADNWIQSFAVALGFDVDTSSLNTAKKSIADYEAAVKAAEKRIEDARWAGAKTEEEIAKLTRELNLKETKQALADAQAREKAEKEAAQKREERHKDFIAGMSKVALAATAMATAISYAVNRVTQSFDNLGFVSARTGASVQSLNSLGYAFKQVGGTSEQAVAAVESFTKALRENSGVKGFVQGLGVDMAKDKADQLLDTVRILQKDGYDAGSREAALAGISEENYALLTKYIDEIDRYRSEYNKLTASLGVDSKQATEASMAFHRSLTRLQATASALGDKLLVTLAPALQRIVDRFQDWIRSNPEKVERVMNDISKALVWVTEKIAAMIESITGNNGDEFLKKWDAFVVRTERFASAIERSVLGIERLLKMTGLLNREAVPGMGSFVTGYRDWVHNTFGGGGAAAGDPTKTPPDDRTLYQKLAPKILGGKDAPAAGDGSRSFRNNNPGNLKYGEFAKRMGATGADDKGFARFPDYATGRKAQSSLLFEDERYKGLSIKDAIAQYAPKRDGNDPVAYAAEVAKAAGVSVDARMSDLTADQRSRFLDAQQRKEGWIPGYKATESDAPAPAGTPRLQTGLATVRASNGRTFQVAAEFVRNFQGFIDDYEKAGGVIGPNSGGNNERPGNASYHPIGRAIDVNQVGRGVRGGGRSLPVDVEDALAAKWGLRSGNSFSSNDNGHFEVHRAEMARAAIERMQAQTQSDRAAARALQAPAPTVGAQQAAKPNMTPGGFDVNRIDPVAATRPAAPMGVGSMNSTANDNRAVHQTFNSTTTIHGARDTREAGRMMEGTFGRMHGLAMENAQSAIA